MGEQGVTLEWGSDFCQAISNNIIKKICLIMFQSRCVVSLPWDCFWELGSITFFSALYFKVTTSVEPMKVIKAYAIATGITASQIQVSSLWVFLFLLIIGGTGLITLIGRYIPQPVIRGGQLSTGVLLIFAGTYVFEIFYPGYGLEFGQRTHAIKIFINKLDNKQYFL